MPTQDHMKFIIFLGAVSDNMAYFLTAIAHNTSVSDFFIFAVVFLLRL